MTPCVPCPVLGAGQPYLCLFALGQVDVWPAGDIALQGLCGDYVAGGTAVRRPNRYRKRTLAPLARRRRLVLWHYRTEVWPNAAARKAWPVAKPPDIDNTDIRDLTKAFMDTRFFLPFPADGPFRGARLAVDRGRMTRSDKDRAVDDLAMLEAVAAPILLLDSADKITFANAACRATTRSWPRLAPTAAKHWGPSPISRSIAKPSPMG